MVTWNRGFEERRRKERVCEFKVNGKEEEEDEERAFLDLLEEEKIKKSKKMKRKKKEEVMQVRSPDAAGISWISRRRRGRFTTSNITSHSLSRRKKGRWIQYHQLFNYVLRVLIVSQVFFNKYDGIERSKSWFGRSGSRREFS